MVCFHRSISLLKLYASLGGNQHDTEQFKIHTVMNTPGSVVVMYSIPSLNNLCLVSELEELTLAY